jgi:hypothetical protein
MSTYQARPLRIEFSGALTTSQREGMLSRLSLSRRMIDQSSDGPFSQRLALEQLSGHSGIGSAHPCLTTDGVLTGFGKQKKRTQMAYRAFVKEVEGCHLPGND